MACHYKNTNQDTLSGEKIMPSTQNVANKNVNTAAFHHRALRSQQPDLRKPFDPKSLEELAASFRIQVILVQSNNPLKAHLRVESRRGRRQLCEQPICSPWR